MPTPLPRLDPDEVDAYLERIGLERAEVERCDRAAIDALSIAHLVAVPFENLDQVFAGGVPHDLRASVDKLLDGRGGWCFELNGAFALLLEAIGFDVRFLGCAVLADGPSQIVEHLALEVSGGPANLRPLLVDVGFGDSFATPLDLNRSGPQRGGNGDYELIASPQGTTVARIVDGVPEATLRFKRVALDFDAFAPEAHRLQTDPSLSWSTKPFATRLASPTERLTLRHDRWSRVIAGSTTTAPVTDRAEWDRILLDWFGMRRPGPWPSPA